MIPENFLIRPVVVAVENDDGERELLDFAVKEVGIPVHMMVFETGEEALEFLHGSAVSEFCKENRVALVLLDFNTPGMSGDLVVERLRNNPITRLLPVAIFSGSAREEDLRRAYQSGANAYLQKPVDFIEFSEVIQTTIRFWCGYNRALLN
jgi:CheY-like chemotaxis protein